MTEDILRETSLRHMCKEIQTLDKELLYNILAAI